MHSLFYKSCEERAQIYDAFAAYYEQPAALTLNAAMLAKYLRRPIQLPVFDEPAAQDFHRLFSQEPAPLAPITAAAYTRRKGLSRILRRSCAQTGLPLPAPQQALLLTTEFRLCAALLRALAHNAGKDGSQEQQLLLLCQTFLLKELQPWLSAHLQAAEQHAASACCQKMTALLQEFMQREYEDIRKLCILQPKTAPARRRIRPCPSAAV